MNRLYQYLHKNEVRQADFAERVGTTQPVISKLANGNAQPGPELAKRIEHETGGAVRFYDWPRFSAFKPEAAQ